MVIKYCESLKNTKISFILTLTITLITKKHSSTDYVKICQMSEYYRLSSFIFWTIFVKLQNIKSVNNVAWISSTHWNELFRQYMTICRIQQIWGQNSGPAGTDDEYKHRQFTHHPEEDSLCQVRSKGQLL